MKATKTTSDMISPAQVVGIIDRRRWIVIIPLCLSLLVGIYLVFTLPMIYKAETLILIQPQKVPEDYVRSVVSADIDTRLNTISQQIMSRSNLEKIIQQFQLFAGPEYEKIFMEDKIENLRERISVDLIRQSKRKAADAFAISFKGQDPQIVASVTNGLARYFMDENLKVRETQALGTSDFLEDELVSIREQLETQEEALKRYRETYMGGLPEQLQTNLRILEGLQIQLNIKNESLRYAKNNLILIEKQIEEDRQNRAQQGQGASGTDNGTFKSEDQVWLEQLNRQLETLKMNYTNRHPDIVRLKDQIKDLEDKIARNAEDQTSPATTGGKSTGDSGREDMKYSEREELKYQIATLLQKIKKIERQLAYYQTKVEDTPKREQELLSLNRDYKNIKNVYDSLLARKLESDISVNMEKKQKGEQFRVLDMAHVPQNPSEPDMGKLFIMVIGAGLGIGAGIIFLLEYFDTSFRKPEAVEAFLELPVLSTIPRLYQPRELKLQRINQISTIFSVVVTLGLVASFAMLIFKGVEPTLALIRQYTPI